MADATLVGLTNKISGDRVPSDTQLPYCTLDIVDAVNASAFRTAVVQVDFRWHTWVGKSPDSASSDPFATAQSILKRLMGDWEAQTFGTGPTYGFHRYTVSLGSSGWTATAIDFVGRNEAHEPEVLHFIDNYRLWVSKAAV
jgi:hypothetical protein